MDTVQKCYTVNSLNLELARDLAKNSFEKKIDIEKA